MEPLTIHPFTGARVPDDIFALYEQAFPPEERRNWPAQLKLLETGALRLGILQTGPAFAGFVFYWLLSDFTFLEYFAIHDGIRGGGVGSRVMQLLIQEHPRLVLEVEPPATNDAERRIRFYERLGFQAFPYSYQQPPYVANGRPLDMWLMQKGMPHEEHTFQQIRDEIYREVYGI